MRRVNEGIFAFFDVNKLYCFSLFEIVREIDMD